jgi:hypothetical protein
MNRSEIQNKLITSVFVTLFFLGLASIYISNVISDTDDTVYPPSAVIVANNTSLGGNIAAGTFFTAGGVLALILTIMLALQLKNAPAA